MPNPIEMGHIYEEEQSVNNSADVQEQVVEQEKGRIPEYKEIAMEKVHDILSYGTLFHGSYNLSENSLQNVLQQGFKSRRILKGQGTSFQGFVSQTIYPQHICLEMIDKKNDEYKSFPFGYVFDPQCITDILSSVEERTLPELIKAKHEPIDKRKTSDHIRFVGSNFNPRGRYEEVWDFDPSRPVPDIASTQKALDFSEKIGWIAAAKKRFERYKKLSSTEDTTSNELSEIDFNENTFFNTYFRNVDDRYKKKDDVGTAWENEVVISDEVLRYTSNRTESCGLVIPADKTEEVSEWLEKICSENIKYAIPLYDYSGNLLWPIQMAHDQIIELQKQNELVPEQEKSLLSNVDILAPFAFESLSKPTYIANIAWQQSLFSRDPLVVQEKINKAMAETDDYLWRQNHNNYKFSLTSTEYNDLPFEWQNESEKIAEIALKCVYELINQDTTIDENFVLKAARKLQHQLSQEKHTLYNVGSTQIYEIGFEELDDNFKEMRINIIRKAIELISKKSNDTQIEESPTENQG